MHILEERDRILKDLEESGFVVNLEKSVFEPVKQAVFLGVGIDSVKRVFTLPLEKVKIMKNLVQTELGKMKSSARKIARIAGKIISCGIALGKVTRMFTREMYLDRDSRLLGQFNSYLRRGES